jgi:hypothetical protein
MTRWLVLVALAACNPHLTVQSPQPPGRTARVDPVNGFWAVKYYRAELSQGVAIALTCDRGGACEHMHVTSENPAIAEVRPASLGVLEHNGPYGEQTAAAFVVIGKTPGSTTVHVHAEQGDRTMTVHVIPQPGPPNSLAAAR